MRERVRGGRGGKENGQINMKDKSNAINNKRQLIETICSMSERNTSESTRCGNNRRQ